MENYGHTIRELRLSKGFSQKEIYTGILSKLFAIDFEKGLYDVKFCLMLKILSRLMISVDELMLIHNGYKCMTINEPLMDINLDKFQTDLAYATAIENKMRIETGVNKGASVKLKYMEILALKALYKG